MRRRFGTYVPRPRLRCRPGPETCIAIVVLPVVGGIATRVDCSPTIVRPHLSAILWLLTPNKPFPRSVLLSISYFSYVRSAACAPIRTAVTEVLT